MKNLKKLMLIFVYVLLSTWIIPDFAFAKVTNSRDIEIRAKKEKGGEPRSLVPVQAWVDENTVYVSLIEHSDAVTVTIASVDGSFFVKKIYQFPQTISIPIEEIGEFQIEISYGEKVFVGDFELK